jgi:hypothetical protein
MEHCLEGQGRKQVQIFYVAVAAGQVTYGGSSNQVQRTGQPNLHPLPDPCRKTPTHGGQVLLCEGGLAKSRYLIQHSGATYSSARNIGTWWRSTLRQGSADMTNHTQVLIYTIWNIWKERCRQVFQNVAISGQDILTYRHAYTIVE